MERPAALVHSRLRRGGVIGFIYEERIAAEPIIPALPLFAIAAFCCAALIICHRDVVVWFGHLPAALSAGGEAATPTETGMQLIPLMGGLLLTSIVSGRIISRTGRYRMFPILGTLSGDGRMVLLTRITILLADVAAVSVYLRAGEWVCRTGDAGCWCWQYRTPCRRRCTAWRPPAMTRCSVRSAVPSGPALFSAVFSMFCQNNLQRLPAGTGTRARYESGRGA